MSNRKKKIYIILLYIFIFIFFFLTRKRYAKAGKISDYEKEIKEQGFRTSTEEMTVEEVEDYLLAVCYCYDLRLNNNPYRTISDMLDQLYMGDERSSSFKVTEEKGDIFVGKVESWAYNDYILLNESDGNRSGCTTFEFIIEKDWEIQVLEDTIICSENDYLITIPRQIIYRLNEYMIQEYRSIWQDEKSGMKFEIMYPFLVEEGEETGDKWESGNRAVRDAVAVWMADIDKKEADEIKLDYAIKTLDDNLYSILYTAVGTKHTYRFGVTISLKTGEILPASVILENETELKNYSYYIENNMIFVMKGKGKLFDMEALDYQPYHWDEKVEEIYDDTKILIGSVSFQYPVLDAKDEQKKKINKKIDDDVKLFYEEIMEEYKQQALKNAEYIRELYRQEGEEGYESQMNSYKSGGGFTSLSVYCSIVKNNHGEFGIMYKLSDTDYICTYDLGTAGILEGENYLEQMITYVLEHGICFVNGN